MNPNDMLLNEMVEEIARNAKRLAEINLVKTGKMNKSQKLARMLAIEKLEKRNVELIVAVAARNKYNA